MIDTDLMRTAADLLDEVEETCDGDLTDMINELERMLPYRPARFALDLLNA